MSNAFSNPSMVAREVAIHLENNLVMGNKVHRGYEDEWKQRPNGWNVSNTVSVKMPVYFRVKDGATVDTVDLFERTQDIVVQNRKHVAWILSAQEMTLDLDKYSEFYLKPAAQALANHIDTALLGLYKDVPAQVGTPGTQIQDFLPFALAKAKLSEEAAPPDNRCVIVDPTTTAYMTDNLKALFHQSMVEKYVEAGLLNNRFSGFKLYESQNVQSHTHGTQAGVSGAEINGAAASGATTLTLDGLGAANTMLDGDIFTVNGTNQVNPIHGGSTGQSRQFVVNADATATGGAIASLTCTPGTSPWGMYDSTAAETYLPYQNMSTLPANDADVTVLGTAGESNRMNLAFHKDAFALVMVPLETPASVTWKATVNYKGISIRVVRYYAGSTDQETIRFDILYAIKTINPTLACRIASA